MAEREFARLACRLAPGDPADSDRTLLDRFTADGDGAAFEALVRRHERTVRSAVGRVLSDPHDAADAAQAAFLVLVRRARHIDWRADLGP
jgi:DNA-directed RNA polymerase specialized sigma24 family protein